MALLQQSRLSVEKQNSVHSMSSDVGAYFIWSSISLKSRNQFILNN